MTRGRPPRAAAPSSATTHHVVLLLAVAAAAASLPAANAAEPTKEDFLNPAVKSYVTINLGNSEWSAANPSNEYLNYFGAHYDHCGGSGSAATCAADQPPLNTIVTDVFKKLGTVTGSDFLQPVDVTLMGTSGGSTPKYNFRYKCLLTDSAYKELSIKFGAYDFSSPDWGWPITHFSKWDGTALENSDLCLTATECPALDSATYSGHSGNCTTGTTPQGESCQLTCPSGSTLPDGSTSQTLECASDASSLPDHKECFNPCTPTDLSSSTQYEYVNACNDMLHSSNCSVTCKSEYTLDGDVGTFLCNNGTVTENYPTCMAGCEQVALSSEYVYTTQDASCSLSHDETCTVGCAVGFTQTGLDTSFSCNNGTVTENYPTCAPSCVLAAALSDVDSYDLTGCGDGTYLDRGDSCTLQCAAGYAFSYHVNKDVKCVDGTLLFYDADINNDRTSSVVPISKCYHKTPDTLSEQLTITGEHDVITIHSKLKPIKTLRILHKDSSDKARIQYLQLKDMVDNVINTYNIVDLDYDEIDDPESYGHVMFYKTGLGFRNYVPGVGDSTKIGNASAVIQFGQNAYIEKAIFNFDFNEATSNGYWFIFTYQDGTTETVQAIPNKLPPGPPGLTRLNQGNPGQFFVLPIEIKFNHDSDPESSKTLDDNNGGHPAYLFSTGIYYPFVFMHIQKVGGTFHFYQYLGFEHSYSGSLPADALNEGTYTILTNQAEWSLIHSTRQSSALLGSESSLCGDGVIHSGEECDDRNNIYGDGCNPDCTVQVRYECTPQPLASEVAQLQTTDSDFCELQDTVCGDGFVDNSAYFHKQQQYRRVAFSDINISSTEDLYTVYNNNGLEGAEHDPINIFDPSICATTSPQFLLDHCTLRPGASGGRTYVTWKSGETKTISKLVLSATHFNMFFGFEVKFYPSVGADQKCSGSVLSTYKALSFGNVAGNGDSKNFDPEFSTDPSTYTSIMGSLNVNTFTLLATEVDVGCIEIYSQATTILVSAKIYEAVGHAEECDPYNDDGSIVSYCDPVTCQLKPDAYCKPRPDPIPTLLFSAKYSQFEHNSMYGGIMTSAAGPYDYWPRLVSSSADSFISPANVSNKIVLRGYDVEPAGGKLLLGTGRDDCPQSQSCKVSTWTAIIKLTDVTTKIATFSVDNDRTTLELKYEHGEGVCATNGIRHTVTGYQADCSQIKLICSDFGTTSDCTEEFIAATYVVDPAKEILISVAFTETSGAGRAEINFGHVERVGSQYIIHYGGYFRHTSSPSGIERYVYLTKIHLSNFEYMKMSAVYEKEQVRFGDLATQMEHHDTYGAGRECVENTPRPGDGVFDLGANEECDDGNLDSGDGCDCVINSDGATCVDTPNINDMACSAADLWAVTDNITTVAFTAHADAKIEEVQFFAPGGQQIKVATASQSKLADGVWNTPGSIANLSAEIHGASFTFDAGTKIEYIRLYNSRSNVDNSHKISTISVSVNGAHFFNVGFSKNGEWTCSNSDTGYGTGDCTDSKYVGFVDLVHDAQQTKCRCDVSVTDGQCGSYSQYMPIGQSCNVTCTGGYSLPSTASEVFCNANFQSSDLPECSPDVQTCPALDFPSADPPSCSSGNDENSECSFTCPAAGYTSASQTVYTCDGTAFKPNTIVVSIETIDGDNYFAFNGVAASANKPLYLLPDTTYTFQDTTTGAHGFGIQNGGTWDVGTSTFTTPSAGVSGIQYYCLSGHGQMTNSIILQDELCERVKCPLLDLGFSETNTCPPEPEFETQCSYSCGDNYESNSATYVCNASGVFQPTTDDLSCTSVTNPCLGNPSESPVPGSQDWDCASSNGHGQTCTANCKQGYSGSGSSSLCTNGEWQDVEGSCTINTCSVPPVGGTSTNCSSSTVNYSTSCQYTCDNQYANTFIVHCAADGLPLDTSGIDCDFMCLYGDKHASANKCECPKGRFGDKCGQQFANVPLFDEYSEPAQRRRLRRVMTGTMDRNDLANHFTTHENKLIRLHKEGSNIPVFNVYSLDKPQAGFDALFPLKNFTSILRFETEGADDWQLEAGDQPLQVFFDNDLATEKPVSGFFYNETTGALEMLDTIRDGALAYFEIRHFSEYGTVEVEPDCGNGVVEMGSGGLEACDDNNVNPNDGCSPTCTVETGYQCLSVQGEISSCNTVCGDQLRVGGEQCDNGNAAGCDNTHCTIANQYYCTGGSSTSVDTCSECSESTCGFDEYLDSCGVYENGTCMACTTAVDDETYYSEHGTLGDATSRCPTTACNAAQCASGTFLNGCGGLNAGSCSLCTSTSAADGAHFTSRGTAGNPGSCTVKAYNDGEISSGPSIGNPANIINEACDDGNTNTGDGCHDGVVEDGWICTGEPSTCNAKPNDGKKRGNEQCDDGNGIQYDGCYNGQIEIGYTCTYDPCEKEEAGDNYMFTTDCGDGEWARGTEQCDPSEGADLNEHSECSVTDDSCTVTPGYTCRREDDKLGSICSLIGEFYL